ncbi:hypothetical protein GCM10011418_33710 [Sphingobacterium alkalisoli]|nr:hypothetical protein GCM10011418_33710 [Sphingobacterium alkalisoli]
MKHLVQPIDPSYKQHDISFLPYTSTTAGFNAQAFTEQAAYYNSMYPGEAGRAYAAVVNTSTAADRSVTRYEPGLSQVGQGRGTTVRTLTNAANEVRIWTVSGNDAVSNGYYAAAELFGTATTNASGAEELSYKTKGGLTVYTRKYLKNVVSGGNVLKIYGTTYYVYDALNRLRFIIPPKATETANAGVLAADVRDNLCFQYRYEDGAGRITGQRQPGEEGFTDIVYDRKDRVVLRQTPAARNPINGPQWEVTFYDHQDRVKATSLFTDGQSRAVWQQYIDNGTPGTTPNVLTYFLMHEDGEQAIPGENAIANNVMMSYTWYDDYQQADPNGAMWGSYAATLDFSGELLTHEGAETPVRSLRTEGMATGGKVRLLPSPTATAASVGQWRHSANYYDDKGRVIYSVSYDKRPDETTIHAHYTGNQFDFAGRGILTKHIIENHNVATGPVEHTELVHNLYDAVTGRPTRSRHRVDGQPWQDLAFYHYDGMGRVRKNVLGNYGEEQDMTYNVRGQLTGINEVYAETGDKQGASKTFGVSLKYDHGFSSPRYDGRTSGIVWRGAAASNAHAYGYGYDMAGRLLVADFRTRTAQAAWNNQALDYSVSKLDYDLNGNILSMDQIGMGITGPAPIDQLSYAYATNSNRLASVTDAQPEDYSRNDFQDGNSGVDYSYDANGNLTADANKGITAITYNHFNKPVHIGFNTGAYIEYSYDAGGNKIQELLSAPDGETDKTDYLGNFVYVNDQLRFALTGNGRTVFDEDGANPKEEFFVKDHLGNVRSVIDVKTYVAQEYLATYEIASANLESYIFEHHNEVRDNRLGATVANGHAARLNGSEPERRIGTAMLMHVMAGDKLELNVNSYFEGYTQEEDEPVSATEMLEGLVGVLTAGAGGLPPGESSNPDMVGQLFNPENFPAIANIQEQSTDPNLPKAFLNYILFDENMQVVPEGSGSFQATGNGVWTGIGTPQPLDIPQNGFLSVFLSNSTQIDVNSSGCLNCGDVFFDQLRVTFTRGKLKEEAHYYPFGLPIAGMGSAAPDMEPNRYKYQGNEHNTQLGLHWMNFNARQYDPQIGRFLGVDPLAAMQGQEHWSPYAAMGNNPAMLVDPWGLSPQLSKGNTQIDDHVGSGAALMARILSLYGGGSFGMGYQHSGALGTASSWGGMSAHSASVYHSHIIGMQWAAIIGEVGSTGSYVRGGTSNDGDINVTGGNSPTDQQQTSSGQGKDVYYKKNATLTMAQQAFVTTCVPAILEYAGSELKGQGETQIMITTHASYTTGKDVLMAGVSGSDIEPLIKYYFKTGNFTSYRDAIDAGHPVFTVIPISNGGHGVLVIGYNTGSGQVIYMDPMQGTTDRNTPSLFLQQYNFVLIKNTYRP